MVGRPSKRVGILSAALVALLVFAGPALLRAITYTGPTTTLTNNVAGQPSTYTFSEYTMQGNRQLLYAEITFPTGTVLTGVTPATPGTTLSVSGRTVRVTYDPRLPQDSVFAIAIGGVVNPPAGTYTPEDIHFRTTNPGGQQQQSEYHPAGNFTIVATPILSLTVTTPGGGSTIDFGSVAPEGIYPAQNVGVTVTASAPYTLTRSVTGQTAEIGMSVAGVPVGNHGAGTHNYTDALSIAPPWTTDPGDYNVEVSYSLVFQSPAP